MCPFGIISKDKYLKLLNDNERLAKALSETRSEVKNLRIRISELSNSMKSLSEKNVELTESFHYISKQKDQVEIRLMKYADEKQLLKKMIKELDSLVKKRRRKSDINSYDEGFESKIKELTEVE